MASHRVPAWTFAVGAILSVQLGTAISVDLFDTIGIAGTAWLRLVIAGLAFIAIARPRYWRWTRAQMRAPMLLGIVTALMMLSMMGAVAYIPLGTAVAIEFLGPLTVAAIHSPSRRAIAWPALALVGVLLLTQPWNGTPNFVGVAFALSGAVCWGLYIVVTQHVGDHFAGVDALAISIPTAALATTVVGLPQAWGNVDLRVLAIAIVSAVLLPLIPWTLELYALRRLTKAAFGTLMSLEPAIALIVGILVLRQLPDPLQYVGIACVVVAGIAAERTGRRGEAVSAPCVPSG
jgi:inner membrane transporter RhtA